MKRYGKWIKLAMLLCAAITIVFTPSFSLAYIAANSNTLHNSFRVVYLPPQDISIPVMIQKTMVNLSDEDIGLGGFDFCLVNDTTGEALTATSADDGWAVIDLSFTAEDVGKTYAYRLYERNTELKNITYDETVYEISITLVLNEKHEMSAELTVDGQPVTEIVEEFENKNYVSIPLPDTGDHAHPILWMVMLVLSGAGLIVFENKRAVFRRL